MRKQIKSLFIVKMTLLLVLLLMGCDTFPIKPDKNGEDNGIILNVNNYTFHSGEGMEMRIRVKGQKDDYNWSAWKSHIGISEWLTLLRSSNLSDFKFSAVEYKDDNFKKFQVNQDGYLERGSLAVANTDYLQIEIQFRTQIADKAVALTNIEFLENERMESVKVNILLEEFSSGSLLIESSLENHESIVSLHPINALRVSIENSQSNLKHYYSGHQIEDEENSYKSQKGVWNYLQALGNKFFDDGVQMNGPSNYTRDMIGIEGEGNYYETIVTEAFHSSSNSDYYEATLTMSIWIDGWDPHSFDFIFEKEFEANFVFGLI